MYIYIYICSHILYIYKSTCFYISCPRSRERSSLAHRGGTKGRRDEGTKSGGVSRHPNLSFSEVLLGKPSISLGRFMGNRCFPSKMGVVICFYGMSEIFLAFFWTSLDVDFGISAASVLLWLVGLLDFCEL